MRSRAFTLFEALFVICILAVVIAVLLTAVARKRDARSSRLYCVNNLKQVNLAFRQWSLDNDDKFPMQVPVTNGGTMELVESGKIYSHFLVMSNELNTPKVLLCTGDKTRTNAIAFNDTFNDSQISYFVGVDAVQMKPRMLLSGDTCFSVSKKPIAPGLHGLRPNTEVSWNKPFRDRHHDKGGNIGLADGSVTACDDTDFKQMLRQSGDMTNRLAIP